MFVIEGKRAFETWRHTMKRFLKSTLIAVLLAGSAVATATSASAHDGYYRDYGRSSWYGGYQHEDRGDRDRGGRGWGRHSHFDRDRGDRGDRSGYQRHGNRDRDGWSGY